MSLVDRVRASISESLARLAQEGALGESAKSDLSSFIALVESSPWTVERPKRAEHGDYATNVAMVITKKIGVAPRQIAEALVGAAAQSSVIKSAEIAGPGFVNLRIHAAAIHQELAEIVHLGKRYGRASAVSGERVNVEFVSANPTGPITVAAARNGIYGDAVATLLELTGNRVAREYYINDFGAQIKAFVESVRLAHENKPRGEGHYQGAYIEEIARYLEKRTSVDPFKQNDEDLSRTCITTMIHGIPGSALLPGIRQTLSDLGIHFDTWFSEESLHRWGNVEVAIEKLRTTGSLIEKEGALMFVAKSAVQEESGKQNEKEKKHRTEEDGRVVKKQNGEWTYFASDIAYHSDKLSRGFDRIINVWGADHHGYIARLKNVLEALGLPKEKSEILIYQLVTILRDGQKVMSSKRAGNIITADEVMDEIDEAAGRKGAGRDALRFFFLSRSANTTVDFDIEIAKKKSLDNPVFYVQYGHARLSSILKKAESIGHSKINTKIEPTPEVWAKLDHADELALAQNLSRWPDLLREAASLREPHRIVFYVQELARDFQSYFTRMKNDPVLPKDSTRAEAGWDNTWDFDKTNARLAWIRSIRAVYAFALEAIGVSAPDRMDLPESAKDDDGSADT